MADDKAKQPIIIKKRRAGHAGAHGGAWKIAYADFITALMAFFLVMWIVGIAKETKHGIAEYFSNLSSRELREPSSPHLIHMSGAPPVRPSTESVVPKDNNFDEQQAKLLDSKIGSLIGSSLQFERLRASVSTVAEKDLAKVEFIDTADGGLFTDNGATLRPESRRLLEGIAAILANYRCRFQIEGHSDSRPAGPNLPTALERSSTRAVAIRLALAANGIGDERVVVVSAYADTHLSVPSDPLNPANRRVVLLIPYDMPR